MPSVGNFATIAPKQKQTMGIDFGNFLPSGITLTGTPTLNLTTTFGSDNLAQTRITAGPTITTIPTTQGGSGIANTAVSFQVTACLPGVTYLVEIYCDRTDGDIAEGWGTFLCQNPGS